jgi:hypothetical protein
VKKCARVLNHACRQIIRGTTAVSDADLPIGASRAAPVELEEELVGLRAALATRLMIGQATGLLAGHLRITTGQAWDVLRMTSSISNTKLRDVARLLIDANDGAVAAEDSAMASAVADALSVAATKMRRAADVPDDELRRAMDQRS